jgi:competence protein ComEC
VASAALSILDVGQGDCIVLHDPEHGDAVLIDCPTGRSQVAMDFLAALNIQRLRAVVVSHLHRDHYGGIEESLDQLSPVPENLWLSLAFSQGDTTVPAGRAALSKMNRFAKRRHIESRIPRSKAELICDRIRLDVLGPDEGTEIEAVSTGDPNRSSLIVAADLAGFRALLGADAPLAQWERMIAAGVDLRADVLLMPHHGAGFHPDSDGVAAILNAVAPSVIAVSVGSVNPYEHPREATLDALQAYVTSRSAQLVCTQLNRFCANGQVARDSACAGTISITCESGALDVRAANAGHQTLIRSLPCARCIATAPLA